MYISEGRHLKKAAEEVADIHTHSEKILSKSKAPDKLTAVIILLIYDPQGIRIRTVILKIMIAYNISGASRTPILFLLAIASTFISALTIRAFDQIELAIVAPSGLMVFGALLFVFDRFLWSIPGMERLTSIPRIAGTYHGINWLEAFEATGARSLRDEHEVDVIISQTWTRLDVVFVSPFSRSRVSAASMDVSNTEYVGLKWIYIVIPTERRTDFRYPTEGVSEFCFSRAGGVDGSWYSANGWTGRVKLKKVVKPSTEDNKPLHPTAGNAPV